jgi:PAS domain S-box-containing protein
MFFRLLSPVLVRLGVRGSVAFEEAAVGMAHLAPDGRILRANRRYGEILGYSAADLAGLRESELTHPDDQEADRRHLDLLRRGECPSLSWEKRSIRRDGSTVRLSVTAATGSRYITQTVEDVTARSNAHEALRQSEQRYRQIVENLPAAIVVESGPELRYANRAALALFGAASVPEVAGALEGINPAASRQRLSRLDGSAFPAEVLASSLVYEREPARLLLIRDRTRDDRLAHAQKLDGLSRLAGGVAHDFNNHLTVINGYCDMLLEELTPGDPLAEEIGEIRAAAGRAASLTRQLLAFSRKQPAEPAPLDVNAAIEEHCRVLGRMIGEQVEVVTDLAPEAGAAVADREQFRQVLVSLSVNAREAMPRGGKLIFQTAIAEIGPAGEVPPGPYVVVTVSDTGSGMAPEVAAKAFEPFFTTKAAGKSNGMGLATVYGIVEQAGGTIRMTSQPGVGTTFRIYLPRTDRGNS